MKDSNRDKPNINAIAVVPMDYHSSGIKGMCLIVELSENMPTNSYITKLYDVSREHQRTYTYYHHILN